MTNVIHPCGKKFLSLLLDLVTLAIRRRSNQAKCSINIDKVEEVCANMQHVENELVTSIKNETKIIQSKTNAIKDVIGRIYSSEEHGMSFQEFIESWHAHNKSRLAIIKNQNKKMELIYEKTALLQDRAQSMLKVKDYEPFVPSIDVVKELAEYYSPNEPFVDNQLSLVWLIPQIEKVLPTINTFVAGFTINRSELNEEELKVLTRLAVDLEKTVNKAEALEVVVKEVLPKITEELKKSKLERENIEALNLSFDTLAEKSLKERMDREKINQMLSSPRIHFDVSKNCLTHVIIKKNRLALLTNEEGDAAMNESRLHRSMRPPSANKTKMISQKRSHTMAPPAKPSIRRKLDAMELLDKATSGRFDGNTSRRPTGAFPKANLSSRPTDPRFSSTFLSPDLRPPPFDYSFTSTIICSPVIEDFSFGLEESVRPSNFFFGGTQKENVPPANFVKEVSQPLGVPANGVSKSPKVTLDDITIFNASDSSKSSESTVRLTVYEQTLCKTDSLSFESLRIKHDDDLFNTSDTVLRDIDNDTP